MLTYAILPPIAKNEQMRRLEMSLLTENNFQVDIHDKRQMNKINTAHSSALLYRDIFKTYFDASENDKYHPYIIETSCGLNRILLMVLCNAYFEDTKNDRVVLKLPFELAPNKAVICPLVKKDGLPERAIKIFEELNKQYSCIYDEQGSIGKRYYRQDEAGTPFGITIDHQTLEDNTVTIRERDSMKQTRVNEDQIRNLLK